jgi:SAM-dependent methyltransferase/FKBP-type peptidyl-prolyl cis-trans isomerase 2
VAHIDQNNLATLEFEMAWQSEAGKHREQYLARNVNFWRDILPGELYQPLLGSQEGDRVRCSFSPGDATPPYRSTHVHTLNQNQFERRIVNGRPITPRYGRFYPKGLLKGLGGVYSENIEPFRCGHVESSDLTVDLNHPLSKHALDVTATVREVREKPTDRGGKLTDWMEETTIGPGMQARKNGKPTDFFSDNPFVRADESNDAVFYEKPRLVSHIDDQARQHIGEIYGAMLRPGMDVLDLMSSWQSHIPESLPLSSLTGLGLNREEMKRNPQLLGYVVHDLNLNPVLPFDDKSFDAVVCSVSVEYLTRPSDVFMETARILRPGGLFIHTFSNRWFPPKAISLWSELSEFERVGLVLEYFMESGAYENLETQSIRGWPRPKTDRYYGQIFTADPVYAVWGHKAA